MEQTYPDETIDQICEQLEEGKSLVIICRGEGMPSRRTVQRWANADGNLAMRIREARELGYHYRAEVAVAAAKNASDPQAGRLAFDAERWYLGKLSNAFAERPLVESTINVAAGDDALTALKGVLDRAAAAIASSGDSTHTVALPSPTGSDNADGDGLAGVAGSRGPRLGKDENGR